MKENYAAREKARKKARKAEAARLLSLGLPKAKRASPEQKVLPTGEGFQGICKHHPDVASMYYEFDVRRSRAVTCLSHHCDSVTPQ